MKKKIIQKIVVKKNNSGISSINNKKQQVQVKEKKRIKIYKIIAHIIKKNRILPKTGESYILIVSIIAIIVFSIYTIIKYRKKARFNGRRDYMKRTILRISLIVVIFITAILLHNVIFFATSTGTEGNNQTETEDSNYLKKYRFKSRRKRLLCR